MTELRPALERTIHEDPGIHFNGLVRRLEVAPGQVQYHLRRLLDAGRIVETPLYGRTHYYPPAYDDAERGALALLRRETARDILVYLIDHGASEPAAVADALDIARSTLEWHLGHLVEQDLVEKRRDDRNHVTLVLTRPTETVCLLTDIAPSLPERLVDRFTRLVDHLLEE